MERKRITCPETAHLEVIDLERTPFGSVITSCSRGVLCGGECARRMDLRERDERGERVMVGFASYDSATQAIAQSLAEVLQRDGLVVEVADVARGAAPPPADYDAVVLGSRVRFGLPARAAVDYVARHRDALAGMPAFWFTVGRPAHDRITSRTGWVPAAFAQFRRTIDRAHVETFARAIADEVPAQD